MALIIQHFFVRTGERIISTHLDDCMSKFLSQRSYDWFVKQSLNRHLNKAMFSLLRLLDWKFECWFYNLKCILISWHEPHNNQ